MKSEELNNIDNNSEIKGKFHYKFLMILSTAYLAVEINIQGIMALMPYIREEFTISRAHAGLYSTSYFLTATIIAIFAGNIVDRIGSKKGLVFGTSMLGIFILLHSLAPTYSILLFFALFTGLVFSIITPSVNKAVMKKVSPRRRALSMGFMQSGGGVGGFLGASLLPLLGSFLGWRNAILFSGTLALIMGLFIFKFYHEDKEVEENPKNKRKTGKFDDEAKSEQVSLRSNIITLLKNRKLLLVCVLGLVFGGTGGAIPAHYTLYLTHDLNFSRTAAGFCLGIFQIGGIIGRPLLGWLSDTILKGDRRKSLLLVGFLLIVTSLIYSFYITGMNPARLIIYIFSLLLGIIGMGWMGFYFTTIGELAQAKYTGIATGLALVFVRSGVMITPPIFGYLADLSGTYSFSWLGIAIMLFIFTTGFLYFGRKLNY